MDMPKKIYARETNHEIIPVRAAHTDFPPNKRDVAYIRADLVNELIEAVSVITPKSYTGVKRAVDAINALVEE